MSQKSISPAHQVVVAIGLCALKFRPPAQSIQAYVLDLQTSLALDDKTGHIYNDLWRSRALELERKLRDISSRSESEHIELLALRSALNDSPHSPHHPGPASQTTISSKKKSMKKSVPEKNQSSTPIRPPFFTSNLSSKRILDEYPETAISLSSSSAFMQPLRTLDSLSFTFEKGLDLPPPSTFVAVAIQFLQRIGVVLSAALSQSCTENCISDKPPRPHEVIQMVTSLVPHVLSMVLPPILHAYTKKGAATRSMTTSPWTARLEGDDYSPLSSAVIGDDLSAMLNAVLGQLVEHILLRIIQGINSATRLYTSTLLLPPDQDRSQMHQKTKTQPSSSQSQSTVGTPFRPSDLLQCLRTLLAVLDHLCDDAAIRFPRQVHELVHRTQSLKDRLALAAVSELNGLFSDPAPGDTSSPAPSPSSSSSDSASGSRRASAFNDLKNSRQARARRLARKDAVHFLCASFSLCLQHCAGSTTRMSDTILRAALGGALGNLIKTRLGGLGLGVPGYRTSSELDDVEEGIVLAALEMAWGEGTVAE